MVLTEGGSGSVEGFDRPCLCAYEVGYSGAAVEAAVAERRFVDRQALFAYEPQGQSSLGSGRMVSISRTSPQRLTYLSHAFEGVSVRTPQMGAVEHREAFSPCIAGREGLPFQAARRAGTVEAELGAQLCTALGARCEEPAVAECELLAGLDVAQRSEDKLAPRGVPVVVHIRRAGVVETRARQEDASALRDVAVRVVATARQDIRLEDAEGGRVPRAVAVVQAQVRPLVLGRALRERGEHACVPPHDALCEERLLGEHCLAPLEVSQRDDSLALPRHICDVEVVCHRREVS